MKGKAGNISRLIQGLYNKKTKCLLLAAFLLGAAAAFVAAGCTYPVSSEEDPIEPIVSGQEGDDGDLLLMGQFAVMNPEMEIYTLTLSDTGGSILFSSDTRSVKMLDSRGRLSWEASCEGNPISGALSSCGNYVLIGTDEGMVYFFDGDGEVLWENTLKGSVEYAASSSEGEYLAVSVRKEIENNEDEDEEGAEEKLNKVYFFNRRGTMLWEMETPELKEMDIYNEEYVYTLEEVEEEFEEEDEENSDNNERENLLKTYKEGEKLWQKEVSVSSFSPCGDFLAAYHTENLSFYSIKNEKTPPELLWNASLEVDVNWLGVTKGGENVAAYSEFSGSGDNLFLLSGEGEWLWNKRIPSGSLLEISQEGEKIVASSWQEYSDDVSKVLVMDSSGSVLQEVELASRIENLSLSREGNILALAGNEGDIFVLGIPDMRFFRGRSFEIDNGEEGEGIDYRPVAFDAPEDETFLTLYFYDDQGMHLLPVNRTVTETSTPLQDAIDELIKGPTRVSGLSRTIPKDIDIEVTIRDESTAVIDLPEEVGHFSGSSQVVGIIDSLILTASQYQSVEGIYFLLEGEKTSYFGTEGLLIDRVFSPRHPGEHGYLIYMPYQSGSRFFLFPREDVKLRAEIRNSEDLLRALFAEFEAILPVVPQLKDMEASEDRIVLNFDESFKKLFPPEEPRHEDIVRAELFMDAVLLTLAENLRADKLVINVEEEPFEFPEDYSINVELNRPFYINPE